MRQARRQRPFDLGLNRGDDPSRAYRFHLYIPSTALLSARRSCRTRFRGSRRAKAWSYTDRKSNRRHPSLSKCRRVAFRFRTLSISAARRPISDDHQRCARREAGPQRWRRLMLESLLRARWRLRRLELACVGWLARFVGCSSPAIAQCRGSLTRSGCCPRSRYQAAFVVPRAGSREWTIHVHRGSSSG